MPKLADMPEPHLELSAWLDMARLHRLAWKSYLRSAQAAVVHALKCAWDHTLAEAAARLPPEDGEPAAPCPAAMPFLQNEARNALSRRGGGS